MTKSKNSKATTVEVLPPETNGLPDGFAVRLENAYLEAVSGIRRVLIFGILCIRAKELIPRGRFQKWIEENCPRVSFRTARQFKQLTEAILHSMDPEAAQCAVLDFDPENLFSTPSNRLPKNVAKVRSELEQVIEHKSQYQLELEFGIRKPRKGQLVGKGNTNNPDGNNGWSKIKDPFKCEEGAWAYFYGTQDHGLIEDKSFLGSVRMIRRDPFWKHLPLAARHRLAQELQGLSAEIEKSYEETSKVAKKAKKASKK